MSLADISPAIRRRTRAREEARRAILDASEAIVLDGGFEALSIRRLSTRCGYAAPTIYHYFRDKPAIVDALLEERCRRLVAALRRVRRGRCAFADARFHDGPLGLAPGGPLVAGEVVATPVGDWAFATDIDTIELQLDGESSSRTTWILVREGRAYIPASLSFPPGKHWHKTADENGAAWIRIAGQRYPVTLTRIQDEALQAQLAGIVGEKYGGGPPGDGGVWFFEIGSRAADVGSAR